MSLWEDKAPCEMFLKLFWRNDNFQFYCSLTDLIVEGFNQNVTVTSALKQSGYVCYQSRKQSKRTKEVQEISVPIVQILSFYLIKFRKISHSIQQTDMIYGAPKALVSQLGLYDCHFFSTYNKETDKTTICLLISTHWCNLKFFFAFLFLPCI